MEEALANTYGVWKMPFTSEPRVLPWAGISLRLRRKSSSFHIVSAARSPELFILPTARVLALALAPG